MKTKTIVSALILTFAGVAAAQAQTTPFQGVYGKQTSSMTRDQVQSEYQAARAAGQTGNQDMDNQPFTPQADSSAAQNSAAAQPQHDMRDVKFGDSDNQPFNG
jgi:hypothetical protein